MTLLCMPYGNVHALTAIIVLIVNCVPAPKTTAATAKGANANFAAKIATALYANCAKDVLTARQ